MMLSSFFRLCATAFETSQAVTHIPVVDAENKLVGIVTAWDVSKAVAHNLKKLDSIIRSK